MPSKPKQSVIIANDLRTGRSVYLTQDSQWSESAGEAEVLSTDEQATNRLAVASKSEFANLVIDPYLVGVESDSSALHIRERIRASGPTIFYGAEAAVNQAA